MGRRRPVERPGCDPDDIEVRRSRDHHRQPVADAERSQAAHADVEAHLRRFWVGHAPRRSDRSGAMTAGRFLIVGLTAVLLWAAAGDRAGGESLSALLRVGAAGQRGGGARGQAPPTPKADAAIDITGAWTAVITEDWALRMVTPKKGDYTRVPMTPAAKQIADGWDPAKDEAAGEQCRGYGAPGVMRLPGRLRVSWQDDQTLKMELEAGNQMRTFHFGAAGPKGPALPEPTWQGQSIAE